MSFLIAHIVEAVSTIALVILLGTAILMGTAIVRRKRREKYFQAVDRLRNSCGRVRGSTKLTPTLLIPNPQEIS